MNTTFKAIAVIIASLAIGVGNASAKGKGKKAAPPAQKPKADPVEAYLKAHDKNKDGSIDKSEFGGSDFAKYDTNNDGKLSHSELSVMLAHK